jgi:hypothetical protein
VFHLLTISGEMHRFLLGVMAAVAAGLPFILWWINRQ